MTDPYTVLDVTLFVDQIALSLNAEVDDLKSMK